MLTRRGLDWTDHFHRIAKAVLRLPCQSAIIDGEALVQDEKGVTNYAALIAGEKSPAFIAFDPLHLDGQDLRRLPLVERRARLAPLLAGVDSMIGYSESFDGSGAELFAAVTKMGLEGIVSKKANSPYVSGRMKTWLKTKAWHEDEFILIGYELSTKGYPVPLLAREDEGNLAFAGAALVGLPDDVQKQIAALTPLARPLIKVPGRKKATWLPPMLRVRVRHRRGEAGSDLRHASVVGLARSHSAKS